MGTFSRLVALLVLALAVLALTGCGDDDEAGGDEVTVELAAVGDSGQTGTATLTASDEQTTVVIAIDDPVSDSQPAHIHEGNCADLNPEPAFGLPNVVNGRSETTVDVSLEDLTNTYAINLHMSDADLETYTSCGDIEV